MQRFLIRSRHTTHCEIVPVLGYAINQNRPRWPRWWMARRPPSVDQGHLRMQERRRLVVKDELHANAVRRDQLEAQS
jgi:hypothetical protein